MGRCHYDGHACCYQESGHTGPHTTWHSDRINSLTLQLAEAGGQPEEEQAGLSNKLEISRVALAEARRLLTECLEDDDFQPCYHPHNHMVGPALRGTIERALAELPPPNTKEEAK